MQFPIPRFCKKPKNGKGCHEPPPFPLKKFYTAQFAYKPLILSLKVLFHHFAVGLPVMGQIRLRFTGGHLSRITTLHCFV